MTIFEFDVCSFLIHISLGTTLNDTFMRKDIGFPSGILKVRRKSTISTNKQGDECPSLGVCEHPRKHMGGQLGQEKWLR